jgi:hypothetical protein
VVLLDMEMEVRQSSRKPFYPCHDSFSREHPIDDLRLFLVTRVSSRSSGPACPRATSSSARHPLRSWSVA